METTNIKKRRSGARNADALFKAWLHRKRIPVEGRFVSDWIEEAVDRFEGSVDVLAQHLGVTRRSLLDAKNMRVRPVITFVESLAELLGRQQDLEELLPEPGVDDWGPDGLRYCGDGHLELKGCGTHFHKHFDGGLCEDCFNGLDNPSFVPRDRRMAEGGLNGTV